MFPVLEAEIIIKGFTKKRLAEETCLKSPRSLSAKLHGKTVFSAPEAIDIKAALGSEKPIEELFHWVD